ncbi:MAG: V-type ATP synthase subunit A [Candidatus Ranarchaeia archaeon]
MSVNDEPIGYISEIIGPVVAFNLQKGVTNVMMNEIVIIGENRLIGEITILHGEKVTVQVYEDTTGLEKGAPVFRTNELLSIKLGPGLLGMVYDGLQRPLEIMKRQSGVFILPNIDVPRLSIKKKWFFEPKARIDMKVQQGDVLGIVRESSNIDHSIMVPPGVNGTLVSLESEGEYTIEQPIALIRGGRDENWKIKLANIWPVKKHRPYNRKLSLYEPLITGQRILDLLFPVAKGGTVALAGGFGTGKTMLQQSLAKFLNVDVIVYVGCGERGNEIAELLEKFPTLKDPKTGLSLINRTVIIANTSNMPVAAREASIYTGLTICEYYRDMGLDTALLVDSMSRWAEALREISSRQREMPGEEGYPPYLSSRIAEFYGRAGRVLALGSKPRMGSLSIIASVSPSGGDFSEPVTKKVIQIARSFWALDPDLAYQRRYPAVSIDQSFSFYDDIVENYWAEQISDRWQEYRTNAFRLLSEKEEYERVARLVGMGALSDEEKVIITNAHLFDDVVLRQSATSPIDAFCPPQRQFQLLDLVLLFHTRSMQALEAKVPADAILSSPIREALRKYKEDPASGNSKAYYDMRLQVQTWFSRLIKSYKSG